MNTSHNSKLHNFIEQIIIVIIYLYKLISQKEQGLHVRVLNQNMVLDEFDNHK